MKYKALLFDVDGVLVESEAARFNFLQKSFHNKGVHLPEESFSKIIGKSTPVVIKEICSTQKSNKLEEEMLKEFTVFKRGYIQNIVPITATVSFIRHYQGTSKIGIGTSNGKETTVKLLQFLHIDNGIDQVTTKDDVVHQKPNPETYIKLAELLHLKPSDCAVIEDTSIGATAAIDAGMDCYIFLNSYNSKHLFSEYNIAGFISATADLKAIALL
jgi:beta-phosphoglucomutase-like phosphatase (HAD superfamily)